MVKEYKKYSNEQLSDNFKSSEFDCKCNRESCDTTYIDTDLINYLQNKRNEVSKSFHINSGFRCTAHNRDVGGKPGSIHMQGKAADVKIDGMTVADMAHLFSDADGRGVYPKHGFVHVDVRGYKARWEG